MNKNFTRLLVCFLLIFSLLVVMSGCGGKDEPATNPDKGNEAVDSNKDAGNQVEVPEIKDYGQTEKINDATKEESVSFLQVGATGADIEKELGKAEEATKAVKNEKDGLMYSNWKYPKKGIELQMVGEAGKETVVALYVTAPSDFKTKRNIAIGSTREDIEKAYSGNLNKEQTVPDFYVIGTYTKGLLFQLDDGKVTKITIAAYLES